LDLYQRTAGNLRRLLEAIGLERRQKDTQLPLRERWAIEIEAETADGTGGQE
jgi:hypothetical protein